MGAIWQGQPLGEANVSVQTDGQAFVEYHRDIHGIDYAGTVPDPDIVAMWADGGNGVAASTIARIQREVSEA